MVSWLEAYDSGQTQCIPPPRTARVQVITQERQNSNKLIELVIDLRRGETISQQHLVGKHSYIDAAYMKTVEKACMADAWVQHELSKLDIPENASVVAEPWAYATDGLNDMSERLSMVRYRPPFTITC